MTVHVLQTIEGYEINSTTISQKCHYNLSLHFFLYNN